MNNAHNYPPAKRWMDRPLSFKKAIGLALLISFTVEVMLFGIYVWRGEPRVVTVTFTPGVPYYENPPAPK